MQAANVIRTPITAAIGRVPLYLASIRIWESLYTLPFCYIGMILAADGWPGWSVFIWITVAIAGVRTLGMSANRIIHHKEDIANPRTAGRHLPQGLLKPWDVILMMLAGAGVFFYAASQLNTLTVILAPVAAAYVVFYSFTKYYTWGCHFFLGWALGMSPAAAWVAVTGGLTWEPVLLSFAVAMWAGGFDIIYGCADYEFDRRLWREFHPPAVRNPGGPLDHTNNAPAGGWRTVGRRVLAWPCLLLLHRLGHRGGLAGV